MGPVNVNMNVNGNYSSLKDLVETGISEVPATYVFPSKKAQNNSVTNTLRTFSKPPVIDLSNLNTSNRSQIVTEIGQACKEWGIFHVINHGVPSSTIDNIFDAVRVFFSQPSEKRSPHYTNDPRNRRENSRNWKETISCDKEETAPPFLLGPVLDYKSNLKVLSRNLYAAMLEALGTQVDEENMKRHLHSYNMLMHYYPPCPSPSLTFGLEEHTDACLITILLQDQVGGLEILKNGEWIPCDHVENALTINLGDQLEILSNGCYTSVMHRVQTNNDKPRISMPCFVGPTGDAKIGPLPNLTSKENPAKYKAIIFQEYMQKILQARFKESKPSGIDFAKII